MECRTAGCTNDAKPKRPGPGRPPTFCATCRPDQGDERRARNLASYRRARHYRAGDADRCQGVCRCGRDYMALPLEAPPS